MGTIWAFVRPWGPTLVPMLPSAHKSAVSYNVCILYRSANQPSNILGPNHPLVSWGCRVSPCRVLWSFQGPRVSSRGSRCWSLRPRRHCPVCWLCSATVSGNTISSALIGNIYNIISSALIGNIHITISSASIGNIYYTMSMVSIGSIHFTISSASIGSIYHTLSPALIGYLG